MKKLFSFLLFLAVVACLLLLPTEAHAASVNDLSYTIDGGEVTITGCNTSAAGELVIPETIEGYPVTNIDHRAFKNCVNLTSVTIPDSVTSIGYEAFMSCIGLTSLTIPGSVASFDFCAFAFCESLTSVKIENGVTNIGGGMFEYCNNLTNITIPDSVTSIGEKAFEECTSLTSITIPDSVTSIGAEAFRYCYKLADVYITDVEAWLNISFGDYSAHPNYYGKLHIMDEHGVELTELIIPAGVTSIGVSAFYNCSSLTSITIPDSVTSIGKYAFKNCSRLTSMTIGKKMDKISEDAFSNCNKLQHVLCLGSQADWDWIIISGGNEYLTNATRHYNCTGNEITENGCTICLANCQHSWNNGTVTKQPTCKEEGIKTYTCSICSGTKTEAIAKLTTHSYGSWIKVDDTTHKHTCSVCQKEETASHSWNSGAVTKKATCKEAGVKTYTCTVCNGTKTETIAKLTTHTYDNACDTSCNICAQTRTVPHSYSTQWSTDKTNHWHECAICHDKKDLAAHTPGAAATETTAHTCTICAYVIKEALGHTHSFGNTWVTDDTNHWRTCACGEKTDEAAHTWDGAACSVCGTQNPTPPTEPTTGTPTQPDPTVPADDNQEDGGFPIWIPIVVAVLGGGIAVVVIILKKKR